jgi:hypothetical protein
MTMRKLDTEIEKRLSSAIYNVELACGKCSVEEIEILRKSAYGEISDEEFKKQILLLAKK